MFFSSVVCYFFISTIVTGKCSPRCSSAVHSKGRGSDWKSTASNAWICCLRDSGYWLKMAFVRFQSSSSPVACFALKLRYCLLAVQHLGQAQANGSAGVMCRFEFVICHSDQSLAGSHEFRSLGDLAVIGLARPRPTGSHVWFHSNSLGQALIDSSSSTLFRLGICELEHSQESQLGLLFPPGHLDS